MTTARFALEKKVGEGGMGEVYLARDTHTGRKVALKTIPAAGLGASLDNVERFLTECDALAALDHPHIVRYVAHGRLDDGAPFLAMQWLEGVDLHTRLLEGPLPPDEAVRLAAAVADALAYAHARDIVHRDLKPSNLFLVEGEVEGVQILDFGVARMPGGSGTQPGMAIGTPGYMAPEQIRGLASVGPAADVYSLGAVLFEALAGRAAFVHDDPLALLGKVLLEDAPSLASVTRDLPAELVQLVARMLHKDPAERPADGAAVRAALDALPPLPSLRGVVNVVPSLTSVELRPVPLVYVEEPSFRERDAALLEDGPTLSAALDGRTLAAAIQPFGGALGLAPRGFVVTLGGKLGVPDQFSLAARAALALGPSVRTARVVLGSAVLRGDALSADDLAPLEALLEGCPPGRVAVDELAAGLLDAWFVLGREGRLRTLEREREADAGRRLLGQETPFVGRDADLAALRGWLDDAVRERRAAVALIEGEAGIGKTRLRQALLQGRDDLTVFVGRADPARPGAPFGALAAALAGAAHLRASDPLPERRARLRACVEETIGAEPRVTEFLGELVGTPFEGSAPLRAARRDPQLKFDQIRRAFEDLVDAATRTRPLVLVLEDLQWSDAGSLHLVDAALRHAAQRPFAVVALGRPETREAFGEPFARHAPLVRALLPLAASDARRLVFAVMPGAAIETATRLVAASGGHPLHLEELIRAHGLGTGVEGVKVMLAARLASLPPDARRVLRAASIVGLVFSSSLVRAQCPDLDDTALRAHLGELVRLELVAPTGQGDLPGEVELAFGTSLLRDAAYATLTERDRSVGHFLVASALEARPGHDPLLVAEHWAAAGDLSRAARGFLHAAEQATASNDLDRALALCERGLAAGDGGPLAGALEAVVARVHRWRSHNEAMARAAERAVERLPEGTGLWFEALADAAVASSRLGQIPVLHAHAERLRATAPDDSSTSAIDAKLLALCRMAIELRHAGAGPAADEMLASLKEGEARFSTEPELAGARAHALAVPALVAGDLEAAYRLLSVAAHAFGEAGDLRHQCVELSNAGFVMVELGLPDQAEPALRDALAAGARLSIAAVEVGARATLALALVRLGRAAEAATEARAAAELAHAQGAVRLEGAALLYQALAEVALGTHDAAATTIARAVDTFAAVPPYRAYALGVQARLALRRGDLEAAKAAAREAMGTLGKLGGLEAGEALVRLAHVEVLEAEGRAADAERARGIARERVLSRAGRIHDGELRQRFLAIPEHAEVLRLPVQGLGPRAR